MIQCTADPFYLKTNMTYPRHMYHHPYLILTLTKTLSLTLVCTCVYHLVLDSCLCSNPNPNPNPYPPRLYISFVFVFVIVFVFVFDFFGFGFVFLLVCVFACGLTLVRTLATATDPSTYFCASDLAIKVSLFAIVLVFFTFFVFTPPKIETLTLTLNVGTPLPRTCLRIFVPAPTP